MGTIVAARMPDSDADALVDLARRRGVKRPELIREILRHALARAAAETELEQQARAGPPKGGSPARRR
jgi:hypothetical protein